MSTYLEAKNRLVENIDNSHPLMNFLQPLSGPIHQDLNDIQPLLFIVDYPYIFEENKKGNRLHDLADAIAPQSSLEDKHILYQICTLRQKNIQTILANIISPSDSILEVGCGILDNRGDSFLSAPLGRKVSSKFIFTDINPAVIAKSKENNESARIQPNDFRNLLNTFTKSQFDKIMGHNAYDTLINEDLSKSLYEARCCLKKNGQFIHILNMVPFIYGEVHDLCSKEQIVLPASALSSQEAFLILEHKQYEKNKKRVSKLDDSEQAFLDYLLALSPNQMERLCNGIIHLNAPAPIIEFINKIKDIGMLINHLDLHIQNMVYELPRQGLNVKTQSLFQSEKIIKVQINGAYERKCMVYGPKGKVITEDNTLNWGESRLIIETHAIIAEKA